METISPKEVQENGHLGFLLRFVNEVKQGKFTENQPEQEFVNRGRYVFGEQEQVDSINDRVLLYGVTQ